MFGLEKIQVASNGFVLTDSRGNIFVAKTLAEAATIAGETVPSNGATTYTSGYNQTDLIHVRELAIAGRKVDAIKLLRDCFSPRLGLREAKEIVENLCI